MSQTARSTTKNNAYADAFDSVQNGGSEKSHNAFKVRVKSGLVVEFRSISYSYSSIWRIEDVRRLMGATFFRQMAGTCCFFLQVSSTRPTRQATYDSYLLGGFVAFLLIAALADCAFGCRKSFLPLYYCVLIGLIYQSISFIVAVFIDIKDNRIQEFFEGFIDNGS